MSGPVAARRMTPADRNRRLADLHQQLAYVYTAMADDEEAGTDNE